MTGHAAELNSDGQLHWLSHIIDQVPVVIINLPHLNIG